MNCGSLWNNQNNVTLNCRFYTPGTASAQPFYRNLSGEADARLHAVNTCINTIGGRIFVLLHIVNRICKQFEIEFGREVVNSPFL